MTETTNEERIDRLEKAVIQLQQHIMRINESKMIEHNRAIDGHPGATMPEPDLQERVARLEKLVDHLYGRGERPPAPLIPFLPMSRGECLVCGGVHGKGLRCPHLQPMSDEKMEAPDVPTA